MILFDLLKLVFNDLMKRKFSSFLTLFAISLGIFAIVMILVLSNSFQQSIEGEFEAFGSNRLYVSETGSNFGQSGEKSLNLDDADRLEQKAYVQNVFPYYFKVSSIEYAKEFKTKQLAGIELSELYFKEYNLEIQEGRFPRENEETAVVVGPEFAQNFFSKPLEVGSNIYLKEKKFKVVGILESIGNPQDDNQIYFSLNSLQELFDEEGQISMMDVQIISTYDMELAQENIQIYLDNRLGADRAEVTSPTQILDQLNSILSIVQYTLGGIAFVALLVGALGIINTMYVIVTEKIKDIGIMKSIGATDNMILTMFSLQAGLFGLLGAILGLIFGFFGSLGFETIAQSSGYAFLEVSFNPILVLSLLGFGFLVGVFAGFLPSRKASKLLVVEALRK